jgi:hypothetical protein
MTDGGDSAEYLCYELLRQLDRRQNEGRSVTITQFRKLTAVADRLLAEEHGAETGLPRYWYRYGEVANNEALGDDVFTISPAQWGGKKVSVAPGVTDGQFSVGEDYRSAVHEVVRTLVSEFGNERSELIKQRQYEEFAPNEFVSAFDAFRSYIQSTDQHTPTLDSFVSGRDSTSREDEALERLDDLLVLYPKELYDQMYDLFLDWEDTVRLLLEQERSFEEIDDIQEDFWRTFSRVELRIHHQQNTPSEQLARWMEERDDLRSAYESKLRELRDDLLSGREQSGELDRVAGSFDDSVSEQLRR